VIESAVNTTLPLAISSRTQTLAIIGDPIEHSITPRIQNAAWRAIGADIVNVAFRVASSDLAEAVQGARALGLLGLMVTIPHKERVLELCDELDVTAQLMGAANLLHFRADGKTVGYSSDGWAAVKSLKEEGVEVRGARIAILGGGGAARSLALTFANAGAASIRVLNRTVERAQKIVDEVGAFDIQAQATSLDEETLREVLPQTNLLVNATPIGMHPRREESPLPSRVLDAHLAVYDIVYNPLETQLLKEARAMGCKAVDGLGMLIYTNVFAAQICAGQEISATVMREEALRALAAR
jgi:shikimate dehydrogenase